ncbi:MAG TPA: transcription termination/antitermination NusG family protein [Acetobacteraceae bacterium]
MLDASHNLELSPAQPAHDAQPCGSYWAVCQTHPQAERWARDNLDRQGYATFLPMCWSLRPDRAIPSLKHRVERPLFGNYLFVVAGSHWAPIQHTRGVLRLLMANGKPGRINAGVVSTLQAIQDLPAPPTPWDPGTPCSLATGPLRGHPAVVLSVRSQHARLSVMLFGGLRQVQAPVAWLVARD